MVYEYRDWINSGGTYTRSDKIPKQEFHILENEYRKFTDTNYFSCLSINHDENYGTQKGRTVSLPQRRNNFTASAMKKIGGGELRMYESIRNGRRRGGALDDGVKVIKAHDLEIVECTILKGAEYYASKLGLSRGCIKPHSLKVLDSFIGQNLDSNPGPTYRNLGFKKKGDSLALAWEVSRQLEELAVKGPVVGRFKPRYGLAGRSKLSTDEQFSEKIRDRKILGRAVWMADHHESIIGGKYTEPLFNQFRVNRGPVQNGFNKFGDDPNLVCASLELHNTFISLDYSGFDYHVARQLLQKAFDIIRYAHDVVRGSHTVDDHLLEWLEDEVIDTLVVLPNGNTVAVMHGVPSGSCFTSLLDSIINFVMLDDAMRSLNKANHCKFVCGDDGIIGLTYKGGVKKRTGKAQRLLKGMERYMEMNFSSVFSAAKCSIATHLYVRYVQPRVPKVILDGSSKVIHDYRIMREKELGRPLTFNEQWLYLDVEPGEGGAQGSTHRWSYLFRDTPKFLSHHFKKVGGKVTCLRPVREVIQRLLCPERFVKNVDDHLMRIKSSLVENLNNRHAVNHLMHHAFDAWCIKQSGVRKGHQLWQVENYPHIYRDKYCLNPEYLDLRAWYRHVDYVVEEKDFHPEFTKFWEGFLKSAVFINRSTYHVGGVEWNVIRAMRQGRIYLPRAVAGIYDRVTEVPESLSSRRLIHILPEYPVGRHLFGDLGFVRGLASKMLDELDFKPFDIYSDWCQIVLLELERMYNLHKKDIVWIASHGF